MEKFKFDRGILKTRIITSLIGIPIILSILISSILLKILVLLLMISSSYELFKMRNGKQQGSLVLVLLVCIGIFFIVIFLKISFIIKLIGVLFLISAVALIYLIGNNWGSRGKKLRSYDFELFVILSAIFYFSLLLCHLILLRDMEDGLKLITFILVVTFSVDTGSYFIGSLIGKKRDNWISLISPNKTVEGFLGGLVIGFTVSFILSKLMGINYDLFFIIIISSLIPLFAILGDLLQSALKRSLDVKDSGIILPGHGGFLDRVDSLGLSATLYYWILVVIL